MGLILLTSPDPPSTHSLYGWDTAQNQVHVHLALFCYIAFRPKGSMVIKTVGFCL